MKQITITVDADEYEIFAEDEKRMGNNAEETLIESIKCDIDIEKRITTPTLKIIRNTDGNGKAPTNTNVVKIGIPKKKPDLVEKVLNVDDDMYKDLVWAAENNGMSVSELAGKWATEYIKCAKFEMTEEAGMLMEAIGLPVLEAVK
jgi:hypothetical protein